MRLTTTTDSADAAVKIMTAAKPVKNSTPLKEEKILSWYMWKGEINKDPGTVHLCARKSTCSIVFYLTVPVLYHS